LAQPPKANMSRTPSRLASERSAARGIPALVLLGGVIGLVWYTGYASRHIPGADHNAPQKLAVRSPAGGTSVPPPVHSVVWADSIWPVDEGLCEPARGTGVGRVVGRQAQHTWPVARPDLAEGAPSASAQVTGEASPDAPLPASPPGAPPTVQQTAATTGAERADSPSTTDVTALIRLILAATLAHSTGEVCTECWGTGLTTCGSCQGTGHAKPGGGTTSTLLTDPGQESGLILSPGVAENGSYYGEISPATGRPKTVYVRGYYRKDGTYVRSHYRSRPRH